MMDYANRFQEQANCVVRGEFYFHAQINFSADYTALFITSLRSHLNKVEVFEAGEGLQQ